LRPFASSLIALAVSIRNELNDNYKMAASTEGALDRGDLLVKLSWKISSESLLKDGAPRVTLRCCRMIRIIIKDEQRWMTRVRTLRIKRGCAGAKGLTRRD